MEVVKTYFKIFFRQSTLTASREDQEAYSNGKYNPSKRRYKLRLTALRESWLSSVQLRTPSAIKCRPKRKSS